MVRRARHECEFLVGSQRESQHNIKVIAPPYCRVNRAAGARFLFEAQIIACSWPIRWSLHERGPFGTICFANLLRINSARGPNRSLRRLGFDFSDTGISKAPLWCRGCKGFCRKSLAQWDGTSQKTALCPQQKIRNENYYKKWILKKGYAKPFFMLFLKLWR